MAGTTVKLSITLPRELAEKIRERVGSGGVSAYIAAAVEHQVAMDNLDELLAGFHAEHGPWSEDDLEQIEVRQKILRGELGPESLSTSSPAG